MGITGVVKAAYISACNDGSIISSSCYFDPVSLDVKDIAPQDPIKTEGVLIERESIELEDGTVIDTFNDYDNGRVIADGTVQDESSDLSALDYVLGRE